MLSVDTFIKYETINNKMEYFCDMDSGYNESNTTDRQLLHIQKVPNGNSGVVKDYISERMRTAEILNSKAKAIVRNIKPPWRPLSTAQAVYEAQIEKNFKLGLTKRYGLIDNIMWGIFDWQESLKEKNK